MGAPGILLEGGPLNQVRHNALLGHGLAVQAVPAKAGAGTKVGPAENMPHAVPITNSPEHVKAAIAATRALNVYFLGPMLEGRYEDAYLTSAGKDAPTFTDSDMKISATDSVRSAHVQTRRRELFGMVGGMAAYAAVAPGFRPPEAAKRTTGFLEIGSRRVAYRDYGGVGPNLLALHGTFSRGATFDPLASALAGTCRVVTIDQRGHGLSDRAPDYSRAGYVADAAAAIEQLGLAPAIVLGHSLGGINAFQLAARQPRLVRALVIEDIGAVVSSDFSFLASWPRRFPTFRALHAFLRQNMNAIDYFLESAHEFGDGWGFRWTADDMIATAREASGDWWHDWLGSSCPALLIHGHKSFALTTAHAREVAARRPNTRLVEAPHCGHTVHDEGPELFNRSVREFVESLSEPGRS